MFPIRTYKFEGQSRLPHFRMLSDYQYSLSFFQASQLEGLLCIVNTISSVLYNGVEKLEILIILLII